MNRIEQIRTHFSHSTRLKVLIANRGEVATRLARGFHEFRHFNSEKCEILDKSDGLNVQNVEFYCVGVTVGPDMAHAKEMDETEAISSYMDMNEIIQVAKKHSVDAIHAGWGFLSENAEFCQTVLDEGIKWIGPSPKVLETFGDKSLARKVALECSVPLIPGTNDGSLPGLTKFFKEHETKGGIILKSRHGGGGIGMKPVLKLETLSSALKQAQQEAQAAFGNANVYAEVYLDKARHVEIQILAHDGKAVSLGSRECSLQRRQQKQVEFAPCLWLPVSLESIMESCAIRMAERVRYSGLGTWEFLVKEKEFYFLEVNPRLQVEHTVTEHVIGMDLVHLQIATTMFKSRPFKKPTLRGLTIQARVCMERWIKDKPGMTVPTMSPSTSIRTWEMPTSQGLYTVRVDSCGEVGWNPPFDYDSLLAKVIVYLPRGTFEEAALLLAKKLDEFTIGGLDTNKANLAVLLRLPEVLKLEFDTQFVERRWNDLIVESSNVSRPLPGISINTTVQTPTIPTIPGTTSISSPMPATIVEVANLNQQVKKGQPLIVLSAMKMQHLIEAPTSGIIKFIAVKPGDVVVENQILVLLEPIDEIEQSEMREIQIDLDKPRPDLQRILTRWENLQDFKRPKAVARQRQKGMATAREFISWTVDSDSFLEYGAFSIAAQAMRRSYQDLVESTSNDGIITGTARINSQVEFKRPRVKTEVVMCIYDFMVLAGTQGWFTHKKKDRMFRLASEGMHPVVLLATGGGGRPGDTDVAGVQVAGLDTPSFLEFAKLSGLVPLVGVVSGKCFAGNAALLGCCDVIIAVKGSNIGMGGPAMIEGGGLGIFKPEEIGPVDVQEANGVIDVLVNDEQEASRAVRQYLGYFQGDLTSWSCDDQRLLRHVIPENRLRAFDVKKIINILCDEGSVMELRPKFGIGIITVFARIEGRAIGLIANNCHHLGGAIDSPAADKCARFLQLCDAFDIPVVSFVDTPGFLVGPEAEKSSQVRKFARLFVVAASMTVPLVSIVLRKGYGLGAQGMTGGSFMRPNALFAWPTGEFGGMGLEGAVKLGYSKELAAIQDPIAREEEFQRLVAEMYEHGHAIHMAEKLEIDGVIDPFDTRRVISLKLSGATYGKPDSRKKRAMVDTW